MAQIYRDRITHRDDPFEVGPTWSLTNQPMLVAEGRAKGQNIPLSPGVTTSCWPSAGLWPDPLYKRGYSPRSALPRLIVDDPPLLAVPTARPVRAGQVGPG